MKKPLTDLRRAELRLCAAEAEVQAARDALDALSPATLEEGYVKPEPADYTHELKVSEKQMDVLAQALEFYSWWCMGRLVLPNVVEFRRWPASDPYLRHAHLPKAGQPAVENCERLRYLLDEVRAILFPEFSNAGAHYGVGWNGRSDQQHAQIAYELRKAIVSERNQRLGISDTDSCYILHYSDQPRPLVYVYDPELGVAEWQQFMQELAVKYGPKSKSATTL